MLNPDTHHDSSAPRRIVVVAAVIEKNGRYLLARRAAGSDLAGLWEFPGGKVEQGESREVALQREIHEELGVDIVVSPDPPVKTVCWDYAHASVELVALRAEIRAGSPMPLDHAELQWFTPAEMTRIELLPADRPVAHRLQLAAGIVPVSSLRPEKHGRRSI